METKKAKKNQETDGYETVRDLRQKNLNGRK